MSRVHEKIVLEIESGWRTDKAAVKFVLYKFRQQMMADYPDLDIAIDSNNKWMTTWTVTFTDVKEKDSMSIKDKCQNIISQIEGGEM